MISSMTALSVSVKRGCGGSSIVAAVRDSVEGVFRFNFFARAIISALVRSPFCSSNSPMASRSYILSMVISQKFKKAFGPDTLGVTNVSGN